MKFKIKIIITIMVSFVVIVSMSLFIVNSNSISISGFNSDTVITGSNTSYLITLKGVPSGNGTYQQLITINNYSKYGINDNGSNIEFFDYSNYTHLYAWVQSITNTSIQVWIKNYNDSSKIYLQVLLKDENLFNANGYLGESAKLSFIYAEYDNGKYVFPVYYNFINTTEASGWGGENYIINDGLKWNVNNTTRFYITSPIFDYNQNDSIAEEFAKSTLWELDFTVCSSVNGAIIDWVGDSGNSYAHARVYGSTYGINNVYNYETNLANGQILGANLGVGKFYVNNKDIYNATAGLSGNKFNWYFSSPGDVATNGYVPYVFMANVSSDGIMPTYIIVSLYHSIDFKLLGSITSFQWSILVNGTKYNATSSNIYLNMTNGNYGIIVNLPAGYSAITKGVLYVNGTNQVYKIFVSYNNNSGISNDIIYAIILASIIVAAAIYFSKRS